MPLTIHLHGAHFPFRGAPGALHGDNDIGIKRDKRAVEVDTAPLVWVRGGRPRHQPALPPAAETVQNPNLWLWQVMGIDYHVKQQAMTTWRYAHDALGVDAVKILVW
jgi:hypothetical protein